MLEMVVVILIVVAAAALAARTLWRQARNRGPCSDCPFKSSCDTEGNPDPDDHCQCGPDRE